MQNLQSGPAGWRPRKVSGAIPVQKLAARDAVKPVYQSSPKTVSPGDFCFAQWRLVFMFSSGLQLIQ